MFEAIYKTLINLLTDPSEHQDTRLRMELKRVRREKAVLDQRLVNTDTPPRGVGKKSEAEAQQ